MEQLTPDDYAEVTLLLEASDLLASDLEPSDLTHFLGLRQAGTLVAVGGFQTFGQSGLLRSIAISQTLRGSGFGKDIVARLEQRAAAAGIQAFYLLTETATDFFEKLGYDVIQRAIVPDAIQASAQFSELCPDSATCMHKQLQVA